MRPLLTASAGLLITPLLITGCSTDSQPAASSSSPIINPTAPRTMSRTDVPVGPTLDDKIAALDTANICWAQDRAEKSTEAIQKDLDERLKRANVTKQQYDDYQRRLLANDPQVKALQLHYYQLTCDGTSIS